RDEDDRPQVVPGDDPLESDRDEENPSDLQCDDEALEAGKVLDRLDFLLERQAGLLRLAGDDGRPGGLDHLLGPPRGRLRGRRGGRGNGFRRGHGGREDRRGSGGGGRGRFRRGWGPAEETAVLHLVRGLWA